MGGDFKRTVARWLALAGAYVVLAHAGTLVAIAPGNVTAVFPPSGLALAALLWGGRGLWPGVFLGALIGNFATMDVAPGGLSLGLAAAGSIALGSTLQALAGHAVLARWAQGRRFIESPRGIGLFGVTAPLCCMVSPSLGVGALLLTGLIGADSFTSTWLTFWLGDLGGVYLVVPLLLVPASQRPRPHPGEVAALALVILVLSELVFDRPFTLGYNLNLPLLFTFYPVTVWAGFRMGGRGAVGAGLACFVFALWGTVAGTGPLAASGEHALAVLNVFLGGLMLPALVLAAAAEEKHAANRALLLEQEALEGRVARRTAQLAEQIVERDRAEQDLARTRAWLEVAFDNVPFDVFICDREGRYLYQNARSVEQWGRQLGRRPDAANLPEAMRDDWDSYRERALQGEVVSRTVTGGEGAEGTVVEMLLTPVVRDGKVEGLVGMNLDVTESHRLMTELAEAQRMETVARMAGGIAHDFNNLLTAIMGHLSLLALSPELPGSTRDVLRTIELAAQRAAELTAQLLALSGRRPSAPESVIVERALGQVQRLTRPLLGEGIEVDLALGEELWPVRMDPGALDQVLVNLVVNARDAIGNVGLIRLSADNVAARDCPLGEDAVRLQVSDTGQGMEDDVLRHVFEPFYTTKARGKGTGLGLSVCYGLIRRAKGLIRVHSKPGEGATFSIWLRRDLTEPRTIEPPPMAEVPLASVGTILFAEDDELVRQLGESVLREAGYTVIAAADGKEGATLGLEQLQAIDLVVTDVVMPRMGGRAMVDRLRTRRPDLPALFTSGHSEEFFDTAALAGSDRFMPKPYRPEQLLEEVRCLLRDSQAPAASVGRAG